jgi:hypothetical protein
MRWYTPHTTNKSDPLHFHHRQVHRYLVQSSVRVFSTAKVSSGLLNGLAVRNLVDPIVFADDVPDRLTDGKLDGVDVGVYLPVC